jgi:hypothetical protein
MLCVAAFIVLIILGIFSAYYRNLAKKAWRCVWLRLRLKPCDTDFSQEVKNKLLAKVVLKHPRLAKFLDRWLDFLAFVFVALTIISLVWVLWGGVNLFVYDTCTPDTPESCALGGEACSINSGKQSFWAAIGHGQVVKWSQDEWKSIGDTISRIPDRLKTWQPEAYVDEVASYYRPFDANKQIALEIIDPGCIYCSKLFSNIKTAGFENKYNLTYLAYPIPLPTGGFKFQNSYLIASYLEAVKLVPLSKNTSGIAPDWQVLEKIFTSVDENKTKYQDLFNYYYNANQAQGLLEEMLTQIGYEQSQVAQIRQLAQSETVKTRLADHKNIVEQKIRTIKIPTIMFDGRRYDRVISPEQLK